jgi:hypothetical protein
MKEQHQRELLKRILRYSRKNYTESFKRYALLMSSGGRAGPTLGAAGKAETWGQITRYMEGLMRELDEAIEINESIVDELLSIAEADSDTEESDEES